MVQCNRCNLQYIGETKRRLKDRFSEHRRTVDKTKPTTVSEHFLSLTLTILIQWNPALRPPRYCDHFFVARTKAHSFSYLKTPLIRPPRYYDQRPPLGVLSRYFLYEITPLIRPLKLTGGEAE